MPLSPLDDYPVHQIAEPMRHVGTSDRNFYDRYYFNLHACSDDLFLVAGLGQYPNLGVTDAFVVVIHQGVHRVVRASRELGDDRMDTRVGPIRIEVIEGLKKLRVVCEPNEHGIELDLVYEGGIPAYLEEPHRQREFGRALIDTQRLAQTGFWSGSLRVGDTSFDVTPERFWGARDRSWGVRPVGEPEPPGIRATRPPQFSFWNYAPMQFRDFSILSIVQESSDGSRVLEQATRVWRDPERSAEKLGVPQHRFDFESGSRRVKHATLTFTEPAGTPLVVDVQPMLPLHVGVGTGYGFDADWRHGMYQGPLVVQGVEYDLSKPEDAARMIGLIDAVARFETNGEVGYGLFEYMILGPYEPYGFKDFADVAS